MGMITPDVITFDVAVYDPNIIYHGAFKSRENSKTADPYADYVTLQLIANSDIGGLQAISDNCGNDIYFTGEPQTSKCIKKYEESIKLMANSYLNINAYNKWGHDISSNCDYTIETWFYLNNFSSMQLMQKSGVFSFTVGAGEIQYTIRGLTVYCAKMIPMFTWCHLAFTKNGNVYSVWLNGKAIHTVTDTQALAADYSTTLQIGSSSCDVYIEDFRITKACRYLTPFTPPSKIQAFYLGEGTSYFLDSYNAVITKTVGSARWMPTDAPNSIPAYKFIMGDDLYIQHPDFNFKANDFTVEFLVYITGYSPHNTCFLYHNRPTSGVGSIEIFVGDQKFTYRIYTTDSAQNIAYTHTSTITLNLWYHLAISRAGNTIRFFIDGVQVHQATVTVSLTNITSDHQFGNNNTNWWDGFYGYIGNIIFSRNGKYTDNFIPDKSIPTTIPFIKRGYYNYGCSLLGNSEISIPNNTAYLYAPLNTALLIRSNNFVMEFSLKFTTLTAGHIVRCINPNNEYTGIFLSLESGNVLAFYQYGSTRTATSIVGTTALTTNTWYHVAVGIYNGVMRFYVDGVSQGTKITANNSTCLYGLKVRSESPLTIKNFYLQNGYYPSAYLATFTPPTTQPVAQTVTYYSKYIQAQNPLAYFSFDNFNSSAITLNVTNSLIPLNQSVDGALNIPLNTTTLLPALNWNGLVNIGVSFFFKASSLNGDILIKSGVCSITLVNLILTVQYKTFTITYPIDLNTTYGITVRFDSIFALYVNGECVREVITGLKVIEDLTPVEMVLGGSDFVGVIDELMVFKDVTGLKVRKLYWIANGMSVCDNLVADKIPNLKGITSSLNTGKISGHTSIKGTPTREKLSVYDSQLCSLVDITYSDDVGYYEFANLNPLRKHFVVATDITLNQFNSLVKSNVLPEAVVLSYSKYLYDLGAVVLNLDSQTQPFGDMSLYQQVFTTLGTVNTTTPDGIVLTSGGLKFLSDSRFDVYYTTEWSLEIEFNILGGLGTRQWLMTCGSINYGICIDTATNMKVYTNGAGSVYDMYIPPLSLNTWNTLQLKRDSDKIMQVWLNGNLIFKNTIAMSNNYPLDFYVGSHNGSQFLNGKIRKLKLINKPIHQTLFKF